MATNTWVGGDSGNETDWGTAANWSLGTVPGDVAGDDDVVIADVTHNPTLDASYTINSLEVELNGELTGAGNILTIDGKNGSDYSVRLNGAIVGNLDLVLSTASTNFLDLVPTSGNIQFLKINEASCVAKLIGGIEGSDALEKLQITAGTLNCNNAALTVTGDVDLAGSSSILDAHTDGDPAITLGALSTTSSAIYKATDQKTIINSRHTSLGRGLSCGSVDSFIHNDGEIEFQGSAGAIQGILINGTATSTVGLYDVIINSTAAFDPTLMGPIEIYNNLTITAGELNTHASNDYALTVEGNVEIENGGTLTGNGSAISMGSLATGLGGAGGTYSATTATTTITKWGSGTKAIYGNGPIIHNSGTFAFTNADDAGGIAIQLEGGAGSAGTQFNDITFSGDSTYRFPYYGENITVSGDITMSGTPTIKQWRRDCVITGDLTIGSGCEWDCEGSGVADVPSDLTMNALTNEGTFKASSGTTTILVDIRNRTGATFTHNGGTVAITTGASYFIHNTGSYSTITFHNLTYTGANCYLVKDIIVEDTFSNTSGYIRLTSNAKITLGTATSQGTFALGANKFYPYGPWYLYGASEAYPGIMTGSNATPILFSYGEGADPNTANLKWMDFQFDINDVGGDDNYTITLDGSCEFDAVTIDADCTLDLNGQRMECSGTLSNSGTIDFDGFVYAPVIDSDGATDNKSLGTVVLQPTSDVTLDLRDDATLGTLMVNAATNRVNIAGTNNAASATNLFVGSGILDLADKVMNYTDMNIATGGTLDADSSTINVSGDLTMSGGLIGKSALDFDASEEYYVDCGTDSSLDLADAITLEAWVKLDGSELYPRIISKQNNASNTTSDSCYQLGIRDNKLRFSVGGVFDIYTAGPGIQTDAGDDKWHHVVGTYDKTDTKMYVDGKLIYHSTAFTSAIPVQASTSMTLGASSVAGASPVTDYFLEGKMGRASVWNVALTQTQIREMMFYDFATADSSVTIPDANCVAWYQFDEGTGVDVDDSTTTNNGTYNGAWAGAGEFTMGTSTIDMTGTGEWAISDTATDYYNVKVAASGKTTTIRSVGGSEKRPNINNLLTHGGGTLTDISNADIIFKGTGTHTAGADLSGLYITYWPSSTDLPGGSYQYLIVQGPSTLASTGDITCAGYFAMSSGDALDIKNNTLTTPRSIHYANSTFNMDAGNLIFTSTQGLTGDYSGRTFTAGPGATITGVAGKSGFLSDNNFAVVGKIENLDVTNEELNVTGEVINCTGEIHQWHNTIDSDQQLDRDTADDRDINLGRDLDKNTELVG